MFLFKANILFATYNLESLCLNIYSTKIILEIKFKRNIFYSLMNYVNKFNFFF